MKHSSIAPLLLITALLSAGCGNDDEGSPSSDEPVNGTKPAVVMGMAIDSPEGRRVYIGAFAEVPTGSVGTDGMMEFGNVYASVYDGFLYVWDREAYEVIKFGVSDDLKLVNMGKLSFQSYGSGFEFGNAFAAPTRALIPHVPSDKMIVWDPSTMTIVDDLPLNMPLRDGLDTFSGDPVVADGKVAWPITSMNEEAGVLYPKMAALVAPTDGKSSPILLEDDRCLPGIQGVKQSNGNLYLIGEGYSGNYNWWVEGDAPPSCMLRIKKGEMEFDQDYFLDLNQTTGSPAVAQSFKLDDTHTLLRVWDPKAELPEYDKYWDGTFVSKVVDLDDPEAPATDFDAVPPGGVTSNVQTAVDGVSYLELPKEDGTGNDVYELHADGLTPAFDISGGIWVLDRIR